MRALATVPMHVPVRDALEYGEGGAMDEAVGDSADGLRVMV